MDNKTLRKLVRQELKKIQDKEYYSDFSITEVLGKRKDGTYILGKERPMKRQIE